MSDLFADGRIVDWILALMALEACALLVYRWRKERGPEVLDWLPNLASGACLLLALRAALIGAAWTWIADALLMSLLCHLIDLLHRWRSPDLR